MCIHVNLFVPILNRFLMLYSLRSGCILLMCWYTVRSMVCLAFIIVAIPEVFLGGKNSFKNYVLTVEMTSPAKVQDVHYFIYGTLITYVMAETVLFVHSCYLMVGVICGQLNHVRSFLLSRLYTWTMEMGCLIILCFIHRVILGWYLIMMMVVILELYSFGVIYSYYREVQDKQPKECCTNYDWA